MYSWSARCQVTLSLRSFCPRKTPQLKVKVRNTNRFCSTTSFKAEIMSAEKKFSYPTPRRDEAIDEEHFGVIKVQDAYRWMEDPDSEETKKFVSDENILSQAYVKSCSDREKIQEELTKLWDYAKFGVPSKRGNRYFYYMNSGLQNQSVLYSQDTLQDTPKEFLDPNKLSDDGTIALSRTAFSEDGEIFAYGLSTSGSDWFEVKFKSVSDGKDLKDHLKNLKFSGIAWTHDHKGVFYGCYPDHDESKATADDSNQKVYYHRLGTEQSEDVLCVEFPDKPKWIIGSEVSDCGRYLITTPSENTRNNQLYFSDLNKLENGITGKIDLTPVVTDFEADFHYVANTGTKFVFRSNKDAPNYRLIVIDFDAPEESNWKVLVPEHETHVLEWAVGADNDKLIVCYMEDVKNKLRVYNEISGDALYDIKLDIGSVSGLFAKPESKEIFYRFTSMITPGKIFRAVIGDKDYEESLFKEVQIPGFNSDDFKVEQVFYPANDAEDKSIKVPMFIASRKDEARDGTSPCLLYGYGGFNISLTPMFSLKQLFFMRHFGYVAIPNIRGGGEYGQKWYDMGRLHKKQNCFNDFCSAAEFLIKEKYTQTPKLTIHGGSNGGLLVGACLNRRPELFGAGVAAVGVMDMLRFHKFTIGYAWKADFGDPDKKEDFEYLLQYSPLHNIPQPTSSGHPYPAVLLTTADHDDRVVPAHSLKFIAQLQHQLGNWDRQVNPLLILVETKAGHGAGKPTSKVIEEVSDMYSFLVQSLGIKFRI